MTIRNRFYRLVAIGLGVLVIPIVEVIKFVQRKFGKN